MHRDPRHLPPLVGLLTFQQVAHAGSFSTAAKRLHVTQGAVSHRIRSLEEELGVSLFVRMNRAIALTRQGEVLLQAVDDALARLSTGLMAMHHVDNERRVAVSCSPSFAIRWLVPRLGKLRQEQPELEVHVAADDRLVTPGSGGIDLCIRFGPGGYTGVEAQRLTQEAVHVVCSPLYLKQHPLASLEDLRRCTLLHADALASYEEHVGWHQWLERWEVQGVDPEQGLHFSHAHMALEAATAGQGVALGRETITGDAVASGQLVRVFGASMPCGFSYWLLAPRRPYLREAVLRLQSWLLEQLGASTAPGAGPGG